MARLVRALEPGESVLRATLGEHWGRQALIAVTDRRVVVVPAGVFPGAPEGLCHADVCWVETGTGIVSGTLTVLGSGQRVLRVSGIVPQQRATEIAAEARTRALSAAGMSGEADRAVGID
jgi:hypothetical protein